MWLAIVSCIRLSNCGVGRVPGTRNPTFYINVNMKDDKMFGKIKKVFFTGVFGILYLSFLAQVAYVLFVLPDWESKLAAMGALSVEWLVLIAARYLSKRSSSNAQHNNGFRRR